MIRSSKKLLMVVLSSLSCAVGNYNLFVCSVSHQFYIEQAEEFFYPHDELFNEDGKSFKMFAYGEGIYFEDEVKGLMAYQKGPLAPFKRHLYNYRFVTHEGDVFPVNISYNLHSDCHISDVVVNAEGFEIDTYFGNDAIRLNAVVQVELKRI